MKTTSSVITYLLVLAVLTVLFAFPSLFETALGEGTKGQETINSHSRTMPLIDTFRARYEEVSRAVSEGKLPEEIGKKAADLWISLQKYMIQMDARIESLKLEAREYEGPRREEALNHLVEAGAERERTLTRYINDLGNLTGREISQKTVPQEHVDIPDPEKAVRDYDKGKKEEPAEYADPEKAALETGKKKTKGLDIEIIIEPEDIINREQDMD
jgi:hypothetical protein